MVDHLYPQTRYSYSKAKACTFPSFCMHRTHTPSNHQFHSVKPFTSDNNKAKLLVLKAKACNFSCSLHAFTLYHTLLIRTSIRFDILSTLFHTHPSIHILHTNIYRTSHGAQVNIIPVGLLTHTFIPLFPRYLGHNLNCHGNLVNSLIYLCMLSLTLSTLVIIFCQNK